VVIGSAIFAFVAGVLSVLSPCVLPLLPLVLGAAVAENRLGPGALAAGLAVSFTAIGLFIATIGFSIGFDRAVFRSVAAVLLVLIGFVLTVPAAQTRLAVAAGPVGNWAEQRFGGFSTSGLHGQFALGLLLGAVWSPCVGPTLGAASLTAARGENLQTLAVIMIVFGFGASLPLLLLGMLSREVLLHWRTRMMAAGKGGKIVLGAIMVLAGALIFSGMDRVLETAFVAASPQWLTDLTTRF
jgi:cytochrome c biogenesis protein CcdA